MSDELTTRTVSHDDAHDVAEQLLAAADKAGLDPSVVATGNNGDGVEFTAPTELFDDKPRAKRSAKTSSQ